MASLDQGKRERRKKGKEGGEGKSEASCVILTAGGG